ncbi:head-tail adaptor protein [Albidovulum sp.]|uniref:head-tail adaptor protein n=1 Tax=Albidovulum sp. TaxID=1872424 RepID=UPI001D5D60A1|nr:head-tail adaptor protein [Paracoccaceae bacterium]
MSRARTIPRLNRRLTLEEAQRLPDGAGGQTLSWVALGTLWARLDPGTGRERAGEFATLSSVPYRITVRAAPQGAPSRPKPDQRFRDGARIFRILAVTEDDAGAHYLTCFAQEEVLA